MILDKVSGRSAPGELRRLWVSGSGKTTLVDLLAIELVRPWDLYILKLCGEGKNVLCTIHQPSSYLHMFTNVIILSLGQTVYCGSRVNMISHFASVGLIVPST
ncbi:putative P-loop containing nucleoside triphosphate hydrolase [Plasmopara halstedii]